MQMGAPEWRSFPSSTTGSGDEGSAGRPLGSGAPAAWAGRPLRIALLAAWGVALAALLVVVASVALMPSGGGLDVSSGLLEPGRDMKAAGVSLGRSSALLAAEVAPTIVVDVEGAVAQPGLRRLSVGARVGDAIAAAGGFGPRADLDAAALSLNLAEPLQDGQKVLVPALGMPWAASAEAAPAGAAQAGGGLVDLNRASQTELESLPGIGPVTAGRIIEARAKVPLAAVDDLRARQLVGQSVFGKIRDLVTVSR